MYNINKILFFTDPGMGISPQSLPLQMFLETDMYKKVITTIVVPSLNSNNTTVTTYKVSRTISYAGYLIQIIIVQTKYC